MNTDIMIEKRVAKLVEMYSKIETDILEILARHFKENQEFLNSDYYRIEKLQELGIFNKEVVEYIAKKSNTSIKEVEKAIRNVGFDTIDYGKLNRLYKNGEIKLTPEDIKNNRILQSIIDNAFENSSDSFINLAGRIIDGSTQAYINVVEKSSLEYSMGVKSLDEAIREALVELSNQGIRVMEYETTTGKIRHYTIEGMARREILNATRSLNADLNMELVDELQPEYVYISEHIDCRPTHFSWQGTLVERENLVAETGYGEVDGLCGINCRHYFEPFFGNPNEVKKKYTQKECAEAYKLKQKQRYYERGVRAWQRKEAIAKASDDPKELKFADYKLNYWRKRLNNYCEDNNLRRDFTREYLYINK